MAIFKVKKGNKENLNNIAINEDTLYVCQNGEMYYDYSDDEDGRIQLNGRNNLDYLMDNINSKDASEITINTIGGIITGSTYTVSNFSISNNWIPLIDENIILSGYEIMGILVVEKNNKLMPLLNGVLTFTGNPTEILTTNAFFNPQNAITQGQFLQLRKFLTGWDPGEGPQPNFYDFNIETTEDTNVLRFSLGSSYTSTAQCYIIINNFGVGKYINIGDNILTTNRTYNTGNNIFNGGQQSICVGEHLINYRDNSLVIGQNNIPIQNNLFTIGNGSTTEARKNILSVNQRGIMQLAGSLQQNQADYAEYFEWKKIPEIKDVRGLFVTLDKNKIRLANKNDKYILGIISANPGVVGNSYSEEWQGKYKTDIFGCKELDENNNEILSSNYDKTQKYKSREERAEWALVGLMGQIVTVDDGSCVEGGFCSAGENGVATLAKEGYYVMERLDDNHIKVCLK